MPATLQHNIHRFGFISLISFIHSNLFINQFQSLKNSSESEKQPKDNSKTDKEKGPFNIAEGRLKKATKTLLKINPVEKRVMEKLDKIAAYEARLAKKSNKLESLKSC